MADWSPTDWGVLVGLICAAIATNFGGTLVTLYKMHLDAKNASASRKAQTDLLTLNTVATVASSKAVSEMKSDVKAVVAAGKSGDLRDAQSRTRASDAAEQMAPVVERAEQAVDRMEDNTARVERALEKDDRQ